MVLAQIQRARRRVQARITPFKAILGDATGQVYAAEQGYYWVRRFDRADANGVSTPGTPFRVRSGSALVVPRGGRQVWVGTGLDGHLTCLGFVHEDLTAPDVNIDPRAAQPNDPYRQWLRLKQIQNFRALPLATGSTDSMKVQVRQIFYYTETGDLVRYNGTNADTHIDLSAYVPADGLQRYAVLWLRTYNPNGLSDIQVTVSTPIDSIDLALSFTDLQECASLSDADAIPIQAFRLANAQTTLTLNDTTDEDLRQFFNMPQVYGFPNNVTRQYRIRAAHSVIMPEIVTIGAGGGIQIQADGVLVILDTETANSGSGGTTITLTGDVTGSGATTIATTLTTVNSAPGTLHGVNRMAVNGKGLVTEAVEGANWIYPVTAMASSATGTNLTPSTYSNGSSGVGATLTRTGNGALPNIDGVSLSVGHRILVEATSMFVNARAGVYTVTDLGSAGTPWILTRATDFDEGGDFVRALVFVTGGNTQGRSFWLCESTSAPTIGTTAISFVGGLNMLVLPDDFAILIDSKTTTTAGGTSSSTTWNNRDLNTTLYNGIGMAAISSNKFVPPAARYHIHCYSPVVGGSAALSRARNRLFNVTAAASVEEGSGVFAAANTSGMVILDCEFTANGTDEYRIDTYTSVGRATDGLGFAVSDGSAETYTTVVLRKIGLNG
jgi:hypothetical protein